MKLECKDREETVGALDSGVPEPTHTSSQKLILLSFSQLHI